MNWILLVLVHIGQMGKYEANALTSVPGFNSKTECETARTEAAKLAGGTKEVRTVCLEQTKGGVPR